MAPIPITEAHSIELFIQAIFYGMHIISAGYCVRALISTRTGWRAMHQVNWAMLGVSLALLANATFGIILGFSQSLQAFIFYMGPGGALHVYQDISNWINIAKTVSVQLQTMIGDSMLIYRCWLIYNRSWTVVGLPLFLWLGCFASSIWIIFSEATLHSSALLSAKQIQPGGTTFWAITTALNILTTSLLVWRIWKVDTSNKRNHIESHSHGSHSSLQNVIRIIVESGLLYTTVAFITFVTWVTRSTATLYAISGAEVQIVGIAFNMIIIRATVLSEKQEAFTAASGRGTSRTMQFMSPSATTATMPPTSTITTGETDKSEIHGLRMQYSVNDFSKIEDGEVSDDHSVRFR